MSDTSPEELSDEQLAEIEQRMGNASQGPWRALYGPGMGGPDFIQVSDDDAEPDMYVNRDGEPASEADLEFIAEARQDVPRLVAEVRRLRRSP